MYSSGPVALEYDYWACGVKIMCMFKSMERVSTIDEKKQLSINILGEKSTTVDTWCQNTGDAVRLNNTRVVTCALSNSRRTVHQCLQVTHGQQKQQYLKNLDSLE